MSFLRKLNPINLILKGLFSIRVTNDKLRLARNAGEYVYHHDAKAYYKEEYGWHYGFPWKGWDYVFTTYGEFEWYPNERVDVWMKLSKTDDSDPGKNTSAWAIKYYEDNDPCMLEIDIVEVINSSKLMFHVHTNFAYKQGGERVTLGAEMKVPEGFNLDEYHLFSCEWRFKKILGMKFGYLKWYVDSVPVQYVFTRIPDRPIHLVASHCDPEDLKWIRVTLVD